MTNSPRLHIVHIIGGLGQGGAETVMYRLLAQPTSRFDHTVISLTDMGVFGPRLEQANIKVISLGMSGRLSWRALKALHRHLKHLRPDVVQTWMYYADFIGGVVARLAGIRNVVWGIRNSGAHLERTSRAVRLSAWLCARLSGLVPAAIVACANDAARRHQDKGYSASKMQVIPNGYDMARWSSDAATRIKLRAQLGISLNTPLLGAVARWHPLKDHENLIEAFSRLVQEHPQARLALVGDGMDSGNDELMALLRQHGVQSHVFLLGRRDDIPAVMNALDIHVLSSCAEGFPNVVAEAMAVGVTNVVTNVGDAAYILDEFGWVVPPRDPTALAHSLGDAVCALGTPSMAVRLQKGRERVQKNFSLGAMVSRYEALWTKLAGGRRLLMVVNNPAFVVSHRLPIIQAARKAGYDVHLATMDGPAVATLTALGFTHHVVPMNRSGRNPVKEIYTIYSLWRLFRRLRPAIVHTVTIKPVLYGGIAARLARVPGVVAAISGLGFVFTGAGFKARSLRIVATLLYKVALGHPNSRVVFQNPDDSRLLQKFGAIRESQVVMIRGSGVDMQAWPIEREPEGPPVALMVARLLKDKGVHEFVQAARLSQGHATGLQWKIAGSLDPGNPASVEAETLAQWREEGLVTFLGECDDIAKQYAQSHIAVLASYREGLPKSLIEAAASGRAVVTTNVPGCRDAIVPDETGLLVPVRDAAALAAAVQRLAADNALRHAMGQAGRRFAERVFDIREVQRLHLETYAALLARKQRVAPKRIEPRLPD
ncbi:MAG TPA: glycosyl transferase [Pusillimonas sp.]|nr:glycosyl transferase [Pusillimonas sp.]